MPSQLPSRRRLVLLLAAVPAAAAASLLLSTSCEVEPDAVDGDRQQVLRDLVANVIVPTYGELTAALDALESALATLRQTPNNETLGGAQQAYRSARALYKQSEAFYFGPIDDLLLTGGTIDAWPVDGAKLDTLIDGAAPLDLNEVGRLPANQRGFPALEWLLFDSATDAAELLARFVRPTTGARRGELSATLALDLSNKCKAVRDAWNGGYARELAEAGVDSGTFRTQSEGIDRIVTGLVTVTESITMRKLAKPLGLELGGLAQPALEESPRSDGSLADLRSNLTGIQEIYTGQRSALVGQGLRDPVRAMNAGANERFEQALSAAFAALAAVPPPLRTALVEQRASVEAAYQAVRAVKQAILTELASALGASIGFGFSDTD